MFLGEEEARILVILVLLKGEEAPPLLFSRLVFDAGLRPSLPVSYADSRAADASRPSTLGATSPSGRRSLVVTEDFGVMRSV